MRNQEFHGFSPPGGLLVVLHRDQLLAMAASGTTSSMASSENRVPHGAPPVISHHLPKVEVWCCRIWGYTEKNPIFRHTHTTDSNVCPHVFVGHVPFPSFSIVGYILRLKTDYGHTIGHGCHLLLSSRTFILPILSWNPSILYIMLLYFAR